MILKSYILFWWYILWTFNSTKNYIKTFYEISYKTFVGSKSMYIWFDKIDWFVSIYDRIRYFMCNSLPIEKRCYNKRCHVIILIKSVVYNKNHYYYNIFLKQSSHKGKSNMQYF